MSKTICKWNTFYLLTIPIVDSGNIWISRRNFLRRQVLPLRWDELQANTFGKVFSSQSTHAFPALPVLPADGSGEQTSLELRPRPLRGFWSVCSSYALRDVHLCHATWCSKEGHNQLIFSGVQNDFNLLYYFREGKIIATCTYLLPSFYFLFVPVTYQDIWLENRMVVSDVLGTK